MVKVVAEVVEGGWGRGADTPTSTRCTVRRSKGSCCIIASSSCLFLSSWICIRIRLDLRMNKYFIYKIPNIFQQSFATVPSGPDMSS